MGELLGAGGCFEWGIGQTADACCLTHAASLLIACDECDGTCQPFTIHGSLADEVRVFPCPLLAKSQLKKLER